MDALQDALLRLCDNHGFATGHGDTMADIVGEIDGQIAEHFARLRAENEKLRMMLDKIVVDEIGEIALAALRQATK